MANGMRQILLLLTPAAAAILVLAEPMVRLVFERGEFGPSQTDLVAEALFWFAFSLPFNGLFLLLTRTFFSLQRPWVPTWIAALNLGVTALFCALFYDPFGVGGIVAATAIATAASVAAQAAILRRALGRLELGRLIWTSTRVVLASAALAGASCDAEATEMRACERQHGVVRRSYASWSVLEATPEELSPATELPPS
jgi:putative peptidoglycan lipid II flippase